MPEQLQDLLNKIQNEGIKAAEDKAAQIEEQAKQAAGKIIDQAKKEARKIVEDAKAQAQKAKESGEASIKQAARNLMLSLKEEIQKTFNKIISKDISKSLSVEELGSILSKIIEKYIEKDTQTSDIKVLLKKEDLENLKSTFISKLKDKFKEKVEFKPAPDIAAGFSISFDNGASFFEFTDEALTECLGAYLNQELAKLLK